MSRLRSRRGGIFAVVAAASVIVTSSLGRAVTAEPVKGWYTTLRKPSFNPPNWAFPVAWTLLFALMGIAFWRILRTPRHTRQRSLAITLFVLQLVINVGWSAAFFGANSPLYGMIVIVPFWFVIVSTTYVFGKIDRPAAWMLTPYIAWVAFASVLNAAILSLN